MTLTNNDYYQEKLKEININTQVVEEKNFEECEFHHCSFLETTFRNCRFLDCKFMNCSISAITPADSRLIDVQFKDSKVMSFDWSQTQETRNISFNNCQLDYSNFRMMSLKKIAMTDCSAKNVAFEDVDLSEANFENTDFEEATFLKANLYKANFKEAKNYVIDIKSNTLKKTHFSYPEVMSLLNSLDIIIE